MFCGYAPEPIVRAVRVADGTRKPVPASNRRCDRRFRRTCKAIRIAEMAIHPLLRRRQTSRRFGLRAWQPGATRYCFSMESITAISIKRWWNSMLAGFSSRRSAACLKSTINAAGYGLCRSITPRCACFNACDAGDIAVVLTEPALTNNHGLILPDEGFHVALRRLTKRDAGSFCFAFDETHTQVVGPGGLTKAWGLQPDLVTAGKSIAGGVPFGAWGMTCAEIADLSHDAGERTGRRTRESDRYRRHAVRQSPRDGRSAGHDAGGPYSAGV